MEQVERIQAGLSCFPLNPLKSHGSRSSLVSAGETHPGGLPGSTAAPRLRDRSRPAIDSVEVGFGQVAGLYPQSVRFTGLGRGLGCMTHKFPRGAGAVSPGTFL